MQGYPYTHATDAHGRADAKVRGESRPAVWLAADRGRHLFHHGDDQFAITVVEAG
jgi:hypothetical protein